MLNHPFKVQVVFRKGRNSVNIRAKHIFSTFETFVLIVDTVIILNSIHNVHF